MKPSGFSNDPVIKSATKVDPRLQFTTSMLETVIYYVDQDYGNPVGPCTVDNVILQKCLLRYYIFHVFQDLVSLKTRRVINVYWDLQEECNVDILTKMNPKSSSAEIYLVGQCIPRVHGYGQGCSKQGPAIFLCKIF